MMSLVFLLTISTFYVSSQETMMSSDPIMMYSNIEKAQTQAMKGPVVLFFHASWCPSCKDAMMKLESRQADLGDITLFVVDYDKARAEKRMYGISYQHTFVQIDDQGKVLSKWSGGTVDEILDNVVRMEMN
jgi:thiol-disulfide isomerase/thioredoxin